MQTELSLVDCNLNLSELKSIKHIINWTIWSILAVGCTLMMLIRLSPVQSFLGARVSDALSAKLKTTVEVGRIDLGFLNRLIIDDVLIKDQHANNLLTANRMSVKIDIIPLFDGQIRVSSAQLFGAQALLYKEHPDSAANYQFIIDALSADDDGETSPIDLSVNSLIIRNSSVKYDVNSAVRTPGKFNLNHLDISNITAHVILKVLRQDSINANVKRIALKEHSGLCVERLGFKVEANTRKASLQGMHLHMPHSRISIAQLSGTYDWDNLKETLHYSGLLAAEQLSPADFLPLLPLTDIPDEQLSFTADIAGTASALNCKNLQLASAANRLTLQAKGKVAWNRKPLIWDADIQRFASSADFIAKLKQAFPTMPDMLTRIGDVDMNGQFRGLPDGRVRGTSDIATGIGKLYTDFSLDEKHFFQGHLNTDSFNIGQLLNEDALGILATAIDVSGQQKAVRVAGHVSRLDYSNYPYQNIDVDAFYSNGDVEGKLKIDDPNIETDIEGEMKKGKRSAVRLTGFIRNLSPQALHLSNQWGNALFSAAIDADFMASSIHDAEGTIDIDDFTMVRPDSLGDQFHLDNLHIKSGFDEGEHFMRLNSDMGEIAIGGNFDLTTLPQSFIRYTGSKLPTLPGLPKVTKATSNNFEAYAHITNTDWLKSLFNINLTLDQPLKLKAAVNDQNNAIDIDGELPGFTYNDGHYADGQLKLSTVGDTALCAAKLTKIMDNRRKTILNLTAQASDNQLTSSLNWSNNEVGGDKSKNMNGVINTITQLYTNDKGKSEAHIRVQPSTMNVRGTEWELEPSDILYTDKRLMVDQFLLRHGDQHILLDGIASTLSSDSLYLELNDIQVDYVLDLVNFHAVDFSGLATGKAYVTQAFGDFSAWADLEVDQFKFLDGPMGTLLAKAEWNKDEKQVEIDAVADDGPAAQTFIDGFIAPSRDDISLLIRARGTNIDFVNSFTSSFLENVSGQADGDLRLIGPLSGVNLAGELAVSGRATVSALNTTYDLKGDTIFFIPNELKFSKHHIYDQAGNIGRITGAVHHKSFTNFTFDIDVDANNLLAYDFPSFDGSAICGTVFATGHADLHGRPGEVVINCNVTPQRESFFAYNAANPDAIASQQFITWGNKAGQSTPDAQNEVPTPAKEQDEDIPSDIHINFIINATPDATLRVLMDQQTGDYVTLNGTGTLSASFYDKGPFNMFGTYNVERGTYGITIQNIIKKNFVFQNGGTITFGGDPYDANLNLKAVYTVNGVSLSDLNIGNSFSNNTVRVNCLMNINGTPGAPRVDFDLEMPTVNNEEEQMIRSIIASEQELNQQVVYLLGIGRFYTQSANNAGTQQYGQTELAMQSLLSGTVSTQINAVLSQVIKNDDWNFGANISTGNEGWHNAEYEGLVSGRMLNNRLLINGQFGYRDNATQATPSFIGDFDIRYLLHPNGNLALKVYNQTNDRYFTRSSLNTQGIGLIMKKDFNNLGDLFHHRRKKNE